MCRLINGAKRLLVGRSLSQYLVTQKGHVTIDIGILRSRDISHREIETQRESSFRVRIPMEARTSRYGEIILIILVVVTTMQNKK